MDSQFMHPSFLMHAYDTSINGNVPTDTQAGKAINALLYNARLSARIAWEMQRNNGGIGEEGFARVQKDMGRAFRGVECALDAAVAALQDTTGTVSVATDVSPLAAPDLQELRALVTADLESSLLVPLTDALADLLFPRLLAKLQDRLVAPVSESLEKPVVEALTVPVCDTLTRRLAGDQRYGSTPSPAPALVHSRSVSHLAGTRRPSYDPNNDPLTCSSGFRMSDEYARDLARRTSSTSSSSLSTSEITPAQPKPKDHAHRVKRMKI